ncbi:DUF3108 domain-containing protein [Geomobilimonas luticola]|uniref:DUF3108 domain-containing protein n=1 Tax=Geomobilimonas luticola TaxID=1114878 RepID=A0ABS5SEB4_9BACT|nr:DUF3108 domain-containing protein [Geomobilimonas luticola]MBT0653711.1 DUF3108 domain-containing protein [Geomobilimonas luticola]
MRRLTDRLWMVVGPAWLLLIGVFIVLPFAGFAQTVPEKLVYELSWTGIPVGTATQEISEEGELHRIVSTARSNDWLSVFFPVDDRIESTLAKTGGPFPGLTLHYRMRINEGGRHRDREIVFHQEKGVAIFRDRLSGERLEIGITPPIFDVYGSFYYARHLPLEVGNTYMVKVLDGKKVVKVEVRVLRKERVKTVLGELDTIVIRPMVRSEGVFEGKGAVHIWLTDDHRRIPVRAQTKVTVGSVTADLVGGSYGPARR